MYITLQPGGLNTLVEILTNHELCRVVGEKIRLDSTCGNKCNDSGPGHHLNGRVTIKMGRNTFGVFVVILCV